MQPPAGCCVASDPIRSCRTLSVVWRAVRSDPQLSRAHTQPARSRGSGSGSMSTDLTPAPLALPALEPSNDTAYEYQSTALQMPKLSQPPVTRAQRATAPGASRANKRKLSAEDTAQIVGIDPTVKLVRLDFITLQVRPSRAATAAAPRTGDGFCQRHNGRNCRGQQFFFCFFLLNHSD